MNAAKEFKQHRQENTFEGHGHAILLGKMQNRTGTIQIIVAIWLRKSRRLLYKTVRTSASKKYMTALRNQLTYVGVFIGTNIPYVPFVLKTFNRIRLAHIGTRTMTSRPSVRT